MSGVKVEKWLRADPNGVTRPHHVTELSRVTLGIQHNVGIHKVSATALGRMLS